MSFYKYPAEVYISYSHKDKKLVEQIITYLVPLQKEGLIKIWYDRNIPAGAHWQDEIYSHLESADIFLLMISPNYLASNFCYDVDMRHALERKDKSNAYVIPIILSKCEWQQTPLGRLEVLPTHGKPIVEWRKRAEAFSDIVQGIRRAVYTLERLSSVNIGKLDEQTAIMQEKPIVSNTNPQGKTLIIHGHADQNRYELRDFLQNHLGLSKPIVMADELGVGMALPQKFEHLANQVEFAIALLTPDDEGKSVTEETYHPRARQNVLIEIGWFWGRLGLGHVILLVKDKVEIPTDLQGLEYYKFSKSPEERSEKIRAFYKVHGVLIQ